MKQAYTILSTLLLAFLLTVPTFAQEATQAVEPVPTQETVATEVAAPAVSVPATNTVMDWMQFVIDNGLHWYLFAFITVLFVGNLVPQSELAARRESAKKTDTPVDDTLIMLLELMQSIKGSLPVQPTTTVTTGNGTDTTITVSQPPPVIYTSQPPVGNTGTSTMDMSTPSYNPTIPIKENKYLAPYETRLDFPQGRQVHVPVNMGYVYECRDLSGKEFPHPNVNINTAYGARFDVGFIAGSWGFSYLTTLVKGVEYRVSVDYSAEVTGDKIGTLADWLWWELHLDNKPTDHINKGISNGARNVAEWTITGTGLPVIVTPRIRAAWASSGSNSAIVWHNLTIEPVETLVG